MPRRQISESVKRKAVADKESGKKTASQIIAELKITSGMLSNWRKKFAEKDSKGELRKSMEAKQEESAPAEPATGNTLPVVHRKGRADNETKERAVAEFAKGEKTAKQLASEYGVRDVTIYAWVKAAKKKGNAPAPPLKPSVGSANIANALMFLGKAVDRIGEITCPCGCGHTFRAQPLDLTSALVMVAHHLANGEEL